MISLDTETFLIRPGEMFPRMVCYTEDDANGDVKIDKDPENYANRLRTAPQIVFHNSAFDLGVAVASSSFSYDEVFSALDEERIFDTMIREKLLDIAEGKYRGWTNVNGRNVRREYGLANLTRRYLGVDLAKGDDTWRLRYSELYHVDLRDWPDAAKHYAMSDATSTLLVYQAQEKRRNELVSLLGTDPLADQFRQVRRLWALTLLSRHGIYTSADAIEILRNETESRRMRLAVDLIEAGLLRNNGSRNTKAAAARIVSVLGEEGVRRTAKGAPSLDADACTESGDPLLADYAEFSSLSTVLNKDIKALESGTDLPIHTRINSILETGRASSSGPNLFNIRTLPGIRECFVPRPGNWFLQYDYPGLELCTLGQVLLRFFGASKLADTINNEGAGEVHSSFAEKMLGVARTNPAFNEARQTAKVANFGFPGGLGAGSLVYFARAKYNVRMTETEARELKQKWLAMWPEMRRYFDVISAKCDNPSGKTTIVQLFSGRVRGGCSYTQACNSYFQGLGADATGLALYEIMRECYAGHGALSVCRPVNYIYDEFILEVPTDIEIANIAAKELVEKSLVANEFLPDVPLGKDKPVLMNRWTKKAEPVYNEKGLLIPYEVA